MLGMKWRSAFPDDRSQDWHDKRNRGKGDYLKQILHLNGEVLLRS